MKRKIAVLAAILFIASSASAQTPEGVTSVRSDQVGTAEPAREQAADFGTNTFFTPIDSYSMSPNSAGFIPGRSSNTGNLFCTAASTDSRAVGQVHLPHGVDISLIRIWGTDQSAGSDMEVSFISSCLPDFTAALPTLTTLATAGSTGSPIAFTDATFLPAGTNLADNQSCTYRVQVRFGPNATTCDDQLFFSKLRVQWNRSIPPAPAVASFTDVPTNAQFFREIEALADTGITAGCTATEFCPDVFVTRRQMAAFLARALGLQPPTIADPANP